MEIYSARLIGRKLPFYREKHLETGNVGTRPVYRPMDGGQLILGMRGAVDLVTQKTDTMANYVICFFYLLQNRNIIAKYVFLYFV